MDIGLLIELCGAPLFWAILVTSVLFTVAAVYLGFVVRDVSLLTNFLPFCLVPATIALMASLQGTLASVSAGLESGASETGDVALMLLMHFAVLLFGLAASVLPALMTVVGRWRIIWKLSASKVASTPAGRGEETEEPEFSTDAEAEEYLERMVRYR